MSDGCLTLQWAGLWAGQIVGIKNARLAQRVDLHLALGGNFSQ